MPDTKRCSRCNSELLLSCFGKDMRTKDKLTHACKSCRRKQFADWYDAHAEQDRQRGKEYREANLEKERDRYRRYDETHKEKRKAERKKCDEKRRDQRNEYARKYYAKHRERLREYDRCLRQKRRASRYGNDGELDATQWKALCNKYDNRCLCCGEQTYLVIDHVIPLKHGGSSFVENIQPLCGECNNMKRTRHIDFRRTWEIARAQNI